MDFLTSQPHALQGTQAYVQAYIQLYAWLDAWAFEWGSCKCGGLFGHGRLAQVWIDLAKHGKVFQALDCPCQLQKLQGAWNFWEAWFTQKSAENQGFSIWYAHSDAYSQALCLDLWPACWLHHLLQCLCSCLCSTGPSPIHTLWQRRAHLQHVGFSSGASIEFTLACWLGWLFYPQVPLDSPLWGLPQGAWNINSMLFNGEKA